MESISSGTMHALLIGIDGYPGPNPNPLGGCVNDIDDIQALLIDRLGLAPERITRLVSPADDAPRDERVPARPATRSNIVAALEALAGDRVTADDRVFIYYSGHGASVTVVDGGVATQREALVPVDAGSGPAGTLQNLIFDVELNRRLIAVAARTQRIAVLLDACHTGGATKGVGPAIAGQLARSVDFGGPFPAAALGLAESRDAGGIVRALAGSVEACAVATACLANELAQEGMHPDGRRGGNFTRAFLRALATAAPAPLGELRWGAIWHRLVAEMKSGRQHPQLQASFARRVFGGPLEDGDTGIAVTREGGRYRLAAGELAGITRDTVLGVYADEPLLLPRDVDSAEDRAARLGDLVVTAASAAHADAEPTETTDPQRLERATRARVVVAGRPLLVVAVEPRDAAIEAAIAGAKSGFLRLADAAAAPAVVLRRCSTGEWALTDDLHGTGEGNDAPALIKAPAGSEPGVLVDLLEHYCRYIAPVELARRCQGSSSAKLRVQVLDCSREPVDDQGFVERAGFDPQRPDLLPLARGPGDLCDVAPDLTMFCFKVENLGSRALHVTLIECGTSGRVTLIGGGQTIVPAGGYHVFWSDGNLGAPFCMGLPDGKTGGVDRVVAIGTTAPDKPLAFLATTVGFSDVLRSTSKDSRSRYPAAEQWASAQINLRAIVRAH